MPHKKSEIEAAKIELRKILKPGSQVRVLVTHTAARTDDIIAELIESWINGNRKFVAAEVAKRSRRFYMLFVTMAAAHFTEVDSAVFLKLIAEARKAKNAQHTKV